MQQEETSNVFKCGFIDSIDFLCLIDTEGWGQCNQKDHSDTERQKRSFVWFKQL